MAKLIIQFAEYGREEVCALCGKPSVQGIGPQLCLAESLATVCRGCGRRYAPALDALIHLAQIADQVGRVSAHSRVGVPLAMLLKIARASEHYYSCGASGRSAV